MGSKRQSMGRIRNLPRGFTFLEVTVAIALLSMVLFAGGQILFSMLQALEIAQTSPRHSQHADSVARFLTESFQQCVERAASRSESPAWKVPPGQSEEALYFELAGGHPYFVTSTYPAPNAQAYLVYTKESGLEIWWTFQQAQATAPQGGRSNRAARNQNPLLRFELSSFVTDMEYVYAKEGEGWEYVSATQDDAIRKDGSVLKGLRLHFDIEGRREVRDIPLEIRTGKVLLY
jgi:prepilin-type N-terminal cleavage/methylation domain-containing protein